MGGSVTTRNLISEIVLIGRAGQGASIDLSNPTRTPPPSPSDPQPERPGQGTDRSPGIKRTPLRLNLVVGFQAALSVRYMWEAWPVRFSGGTMPLALITSANHLRC
ncbi:hypothetical protein GE21DRAFT_1207040 [Neurospora crassa]|nr:hypothetical protein GE21DRAFT_1207040 [Neurospora crassa]